MYFIRFFCLAYFVFEEGFCSLQIIRSLTTQAMANALYFSTGSLSPENFFHYGLALDRYTHFTSPIRRYADVIVSVFVGLFSLNIYILFSQVL